MTTQPPPRLLLIISGSVAAYKSLELIRLFKQCGGEVSCILTKGAAKFITPLAVGSLSQSEVYTDLFSLKDETEMGHIRLSREADLMLVAPASANLIAKMAQGLADDLASTVLLATNKPVMVAPAMNPQMWQHPATQRNLRQLQEDGISIVPPDSGAMACAETGEGRMPDPAALCEAVWQRLQSPSRPLQGKRAIVTAGPTAEALDPVRYLSNHSSGKQGYAIAEALAQAGAEVTLISGPTQLPCPSGVERLHVQTAEEMLSACESSLPADIFVSTAAVCDWRAAQVSPTKLKKRGQDSLTLHLNQTPDILRSICEHPDRPTLTIGFAAETATHQAALVTLAQEKRKRKGCDWIVANNVSNGMIFGDSDTEITLLAGEDVTIRQKCSKIEVARFLTEKMIDSFNHHKTKVSTHE